MLKIVEQSLLFDFYGELLTDHQKNIYEDVMNDLSISEIAREQGISRQGIHDLVKRCDSILKEYENKLHLVEKFLNTKKDVLNIQKLADEFKESNDIELISEIYDISQKILSEI